MLLKVKYNAGSIGTVDVLAKTLGMDRQVLLDMANTASARYYEFSLKKKDKTDRLITAPNFDLKLVQKRINKAIFENVSYPDYLYGGVSEKDYFKNAIRHSGAHVLISLDIRNFYPSITYASVKKIFQYFCKFSEDVSSILADLTTKDGFVPQGACTSSHLANLLFFDLEHDLVHQLKQQKIVYSRLLDDICLSSTKPLAEKKIQELINKISVFTKLAGCQLKKKKTRITSVSNPENLMYVTGLWINRGRPRVDRVERDLIRVQVNKCIEYSKLSKETQGYHALHNRVSGLVSKLSYIGHPEANGFRVSLQSALPEYGTYDEYKTQKDVVSLSKASKDTRKKLAYYVRFHQMKYRVSIHFRTNTDLARKLTETLNKCTPLATREELIYG